MNGALPDQVDLEMIRFVRDLNTRRRLNSQEVLTELTAGAVRLLPSAQHAGVTSSQANEVGTRSSTGPVAAELDSIQGEYGVGPCVWAAKHEDVVRIDDVENDPRWPRYSSAVVERTPVRSVLSLALVADTPGRNALNVYAEKRHAFDVGITKTAVMYAGYMAMAWMTARRDEQFHHALGSRDIIGQAKGMIMERFDVDATQAFELLKRLSQTSNTPLGKVAVQLVEAEHRESRPPGPTT